MVHATGRSFARLWAAALLLPALSGCSGSTSTLTRSTRSAQLDSPSGSSLTRGTPGALDVTPTQLRLGTREYVAGILAQVFGPSAQAFTSDLETQTADTMGGRCDRYDPDCRQPAAAVLPPGTAQRLATTIRHCDQILQQDAPVAYARSIARGENPAAPSAMSKPAAPELAAITTMFYRGKDVPTEVVSALQAVSDASAAQGQPPVDAWRFVLFALCNSPHWQSP